MTISTQQVNPKVVYFPGALTAQLSLVGGKGQSLIRMAQIGLPTPPGFVLTVEFFTSWINELKLSKEWKSYCAADQKDLEQACNKLKELANKLQFSEEQKQEIDEALDSLENVELLAVRSSSPEEDLEGFSFAGGYETILGVKRAEIESAVRNAFKSCLDYRVQCYKLTNGFNVLEPQIAVVVQEQIASEISGVVFSINPLNNNYDEVVFNANWGLGESVVSGACTPDTVIVDKWRMQVKERHAGAKESKILLLEKGGTKEVKEGDDSELCLGDGTALSLTRYVKTLEEVFRKPVDIEWAVAKDREWILQARPITSFVPLPDELITPPNRPKKLYLDVSLTVQALDRPVSAMGCSIMKRLGRYAGKKVYGVNPFGDGSGKGFARVAGGRFYLDVSSILSIMSKESLAQKFVNLDTVVANSIRDLDTSKYRSEVSPKILLVPFTLLPNMAKVLPSVIHARAFPYKAHKKAQEELQKHLAKQKRFAEENKNLAIAKFIDLLFEETGEFIFKYSLPSFLGSRYALERMKKAARIIDPEMLKRLEVALPHNVTTEMGLSLYALSQTLGEKEAQKLNPEKKVEDQDLSEEFKSEWITFLEKYGHRAPGELDIASPRYCENPSTLLTQIKALALDDNEDNNPKKRFEEGVKERAKTYQEICQRLKDIDKSKLNRFRNTYNAWELLGGYRELHKYCVIYFISLVRKRLLDEAEKLVDRGQLETLDQIFDLSIEDLEKHGSWSKEDLSERAKLNCQFTDKLKSVKRLPALIDSRGEIIRPKMASLKDGEVAGAPISQGVVTGKVKVLNTPDEKPLEVGEILVARATDPGWTPLFVNAAGLILEVGGLLQHGALVAREYGLPCVGGVTGATNLFQDGDLVEVDGDRGIVKVLQSSDSD